MTFDTKQTPETKWEMAQELVDSMPPAKMDEMARYIRDAVKNAQKLSRCVKGDRYQISIVADANGDCWLAATIMQRDRIVGGPYAVIPLLLSEGEGFVPTQQQIHDEWTRRFAILPDIQESIPPFRA